MDSGGLCRVHVGRRRRVSGGVGGGGGGGGECSDSLCSWLSAFAGLHAVARPRTPDGAASVEGEEVPMAIGAPSHTHGLSFTRKLQPMNNNSPRTFLTEAVEAASGPREEGWPGRREGVERKAAWCSCAEERGRPCALQRQVSAVLRVRSDRASASVRLQRVGLSCCDAETGATVLLHGQVQFLGVVAMPVVVGSGGGTAARRRRQSASSAF